MSLENGQTSRGVATAHIQAAKRTASGVLLSEVETEQVSWLWRGWLALGKLSVIDGDPGLGKSATVLDVAARVSTGREFADGTRNEAGPGGVVILSAEDALSDTIKPRLEAAGADLERIASLAMLPDGSGHERLLSIPEDLQHLETEIQRMEAKLVIVDPLVAFFSKKVDSHKDQDVRRALAPLAAVAERTGAAVQLVRHLSKGEGKNPVYRGGGSIGIIGAARIGSLVAKDPKDEERRVLAPVKNNLAVLPDSGTHKD
jgi:putative DNA primase/helicase